MGLAACYRDAEALQGLTTLATNVFKARKLLRDAAPFWVGRAASALAIRLGGPQA